jgi:hypothetical protein
VGRKESLKAQDPFRTVHAMIAQKLGYYDSLPDKRVIQLRLALECAAVTALFWLWFIAYVTVVPSAQGLAPGAYVPYLAALLTGLFLETFTANAKKAIGQIQDGSLASQHPTLVRQMWFSVGVLLVFLVLTKDSSISRTFLLSFIPAEYFLLLVLHRCSPPAVSSTVLQRRKRRTGAAGLNRRRTAAGWKDG